MERANTGIPYPTGGRDVRFEGSLPHQFQYRDQGRTVVSDTEPAFTDMGRNRNVPFPADGSALPHELQHHGVPRQHPNPRMRGMGRRKWAGRPPGPPSNIGYDRMGGGLGGLQQTTGLWQDWKRIFNRTGNEDLANQWVESQQVASADTGLGSTNEYQMAKVYTNQDPGMVNRPKFWFDSIAPEGEAINKVLNMPGIEGMRQGSEKDWNYDDYNKMIPDWLREQLPDEAFETLSDFRNQQRITT